MRYRPFAFPGVLAVVVAAMMGAHAFAADPAAPAAPSKATRAATGTWTVPRTADGQPDLQGVWANNNATPLQRPKAFAGRAVLTDDELALLKKRAAELFSGDGDAAFGDSFYEALLADAKKFTSRDGKTGDYNHFWVVERDFDNRTSLIVDPPDGRLPPTTAEAQERQAAGEERRRRPAEGPESRSLSERCITFGTPRIQAGYNSYYQIFQTKDYVVIGMETIHDARVIPMDGRPHVAPNVRQWLGDSRGHWDGDTLVVDTTNFSPKSNFLGAHDHLHLVERFTRVGPNSINYEIKVEDPTTWTEPWTAMIPLRHSNDQIFEYACHEGNSGLAGILAGARAEEKAAATLSKGSKQ